MQKKTIQLVVKNKMTAWLETITDKALRKRVSENLLVSGGCIASMFLKEDVNDYDVYLQDMDVLKDLAEYYCKGKVLDGRKRKFHLKQFNIINWNDSDYMSERYIRVFNLKSDQIKLNIPSRGTLIEYIGDDAPKEGEYLPIFLSQNAISLSDDVQIVLRFNGSPEEIHLNYDYIHATNYFTMKDGLITNLTAMESLITKQLKYQGSLYPLTSIIRMKKFISRQWKITAGEILKILFQVSELDLTDINVLEEQLIGVDVAYFSTLIAVLRNEDSSSISSKMISDLIDEVFEKYEEPQ